MAGEYIQAEDLESYWKQLKAYYEVNSPRFEIITKEQYEAIQRSEREDSDNHLNYERLGDDTKAVDIAFYKYLPGSRTAFRVHIVDVDGNRADYYFLVNSF